MGHGPIKKISATVPSGHGCGVLISIFREPFRLSRGLGWGGGRPSCGGQICKGSFVRHFAAFCSTRGPQMLNFRRKLQFFTTFLKKHAEIYVLRAKLRREVWDPSTFSLCATCSVLCFWGTSFRTHPRPLYADFSKIPKEDQ